MTTHPPATTELIETGDCREGLIGLPSRFEIDDGDPDGRGGWSVVVKGDAYDIITALDNTSVSMRALDAESIRGGARLVRIVCTPGGTLNGRPRSGHGGGRPDVRL